MQGSTSRYLRYLQWAALVAVSFLFACAYYQDPLFTSNQNTYFLPGMARAGFGQLSADWLARQTDAVPVFTAFVYSVHSMGAPWIYYVVHALLAALYAGSLFLLVRSVLGPQLGPQMGAPLRDVAVPSEKSGRSSALAALLFFGLLTLAHSPWLIDAALESVGLGLRVAWRLQNLMYGVAAQYTLSRILQPSLFGILMITSLACFVRGRVIAAILCALIAAYMHTSMVLHAGILTIAYMAALIVARRSATDFKAAVKSAVKIGLLALVLITPIAMYLALRFVLSDPADIQKAGGLISADLRQPHHALISVWFRFAVLVPLGWIAGGLFLAYRNRKGSQDGNPGLNAVAQYRLFLVLVICTGIAVALTLLQAVTGSRSLALMFPWRASAWLVPVCAALIIGRFAGWGAARLESSLEGTVPWRRGASIAVVCATTLFLVVAAALGASKTVAGARTDLDAGSVIGYARDHVAQGQVYLVPLDFDRFRLATGVPVFVDWKSFPYRNREILEWYSRVKLAKEFYETGDRDSARAALQEIRAIEPVTHVIVVGASCAFTEGDLVFKDTGYAVCRLGSQTP